jgi:hypothetical protein
METSRRGFMGLLAGSVLGTILGPKLFAGVEKAPLLAKAVQSHVPRETYLPLEIFTSTMLEIVNRELKWLRLKQVPAAWSWLDHARLGTTAMIREPVRFTPNWAVGFDPEPFIDHAIPVNLCHQLGVDMSLSEIDWERPWPQISDRYAVPSGLLMAENVIRHVRQNGGADYLVCGELMQPAGVDRTTLARHSEGLCLRGLQYVDVRRSEHIIRFDMLFGLGNSRER